MFPWILLRHYGKNFRKKSKESCRCRRLQISGKKKLIISICLIGIVLLAIVPRIVSRVRFEIFCIFGPPAFYGVEDDITFPDIIARCPDDIFDYVKEFKAKNEMDSFIDSSMINDSIIIGKVFNYDAIPELDISLVQTYSGRSWGIGQHLFVGSTIHRGWKEVSLPENMIFQDATLLPDDNGYIIFLSRWNNWRPYRDKYERFLKSHNDKTLRAERSVYIFNPTTKKLDYLFPGYHLVPSPDRLYIGYMISQSLYGGKHMIMIYDRQTKQSKSVLSLYESDLGSGSSFDYVWSKDSKVLFLKGGTSGFDKQQPFKKGNFQLIYSIENGVLYDVESYNL